jgi:hypothetical protein
MTRPPMARQGRRPIRHRPELHYLLLQARLRPGAQRAAKRATGLSACGRDAPVRCVRREPSLVSGA